MSKSVKVLKEIGIALLILTGIIICMVYLFVTKIPIAVEVPEADIYVSVDRNDYAVATNGIEDAQNETVIYQSTNAELEQYTEDLRYTTGKTEPLTNPTPGVSDIPTDIIQKNNTTENEI